jgi:glycosyltransferase involved in cell wall biosynthesis
MRIAQVAPLIESVPPKHYGGTERIVSYLTEELVRAGHDVTLFASGDSITNARLVASCERSLRKNERLDLPDLISVFDRFRNEPLISISNAQRRPMPWANWHSTIYHGLPEDLFTFQPNQGDYLAFLGRISPEKGADQAIEIAARAKMPLKIAAKVDRADKRYFKKEIEPLLTQSHVEWVGEISDQQKNEFLGNAYALLFPIDWPEPFGLVMIEAMACGTPIIAYDRGSVPEVMENGVTGFIVNEIDQAVQAVGRIRELNRAGCRGVFEKRFTASRMASDYVDAFERLTDSWTGTMGQAPMSSLHALQSA